MTDWRTRVADEPSGLRDITSAYFTDIAEQLFPKELVDKAVVYLNDNANLAAKDHIIFVGMKKGMGIENDFYNPPYSEKMYISGLAGVISNLHEHLKLERPTIDKVTEKTEAAVASAINNMINAGKGKNA